MSKFVAVLSACALLGATTAHAADLTLVVAGVKNGEGAIRAMLFDKPDGFRHEDKARTVLSVPAQTGEVSLIFTDLAPGTYGVIAYHDENGNNALDKFLGMVPTEGFALTNDPEVMGPRSFDSAAFTLGEGGGQQVVHLKY